MLAKAEHIDIGICFWQNDKLFFRFYFYICVLRKSFFRKPKRNAEKRTLNLWFRSDIFGAIGRKECEEEVKLEFVCSSFTFFPKTEAKTPQRERKQFECAETVRSWDSGTLFKQVR